MTVVREGRGPRVVRRVRGVVGIAVVQGMVVTGGGVGGVAGRGLWVLLVWRVFFGGFGIVVELEVLSRECCRSDVSFVSLFYCF